MTTTYKEPLRTKFSELPYNRPNMDVVKNSYAEIIQNLSNATSLDGALTALRAWNQLRMELNTMSSIAYVHYTQNVKSETARADKKFFDENGPTLAELDVQLSQAVVNSAFRAGLEAEFGSLFFKKIENRLRSFIPEMKPLLIQESELTQRYTDILASAEIEFRGQTYNLSGLGKFCLSSDRATRKEAHQARFSYFDKNAAELDEIYDSLVKIRHQMAEMLGFKDFVELGYVNMGRLDYTAADVKVFRNQVREIVVPIVEKIRQKQAERLGIPKIKFHDEDMQFSEGNPTPKDEPAKIVSTAREMYRELSPQTGEFFDLMCDLELMDLVTRPNKSGGGYCTSFPSFGLPFIYSNFNGTAHDIEVLTHEAGHAFQAYMSRHFGVPEYLSPTMEACEIHSMSMEFLTWPWMERFFYDDTEKFKFCHLLHSLLFLPYACTVDEFQEWVYSHPSATPQERKAQWLAIEKTYQPWREYEDIPFAESGAIWQRQAHIFELPFYYIDYALAQICALQFWSRSQKDSTSALMDYIKVCEIGGSMSFLDIIKAGNLISPFDPKCLKMFMGEVIIWLNDWYNRYSGEESLPHPEIEELVH